MQTLKLRIKSIGTERECIVDQFPVVLGCAEGADIQISDRCICHEHCEITNLGGQLFLRDLDATHGTFLNRRPVKRVPLRMGDQLGMGFATVVVDEIAHTGPNVATAS